MRRREVKDNISLKISFSLQTHFNFILWSGGCLSQSGGRSSHFSDFWKLEITSYDKLLEWHLLGFLCEKNFGRNGGWSFSHLKTALFMFLTNVFNHNEGMLDHLNRHVPIYANHGPLRECRRSSELWSRLASSLGCLPACKSCSIIQAVSWRL